VGETEVPTGTVRLSGGVSKGVASEEKEKAKQTPVTVVESSPTPVARLLDKGSTVEDNASETTPASVVRRHRRHHHQQTNE
jgi:hypothetical protein